MPAEALKDLPRLHRSPAPKPEPGIVHLGLGAFFRAFGAIYIEDAVKATGGDWGIIGVSLRSPDTREPARAPGLGLYLRRTRTGR